MDPITLAEMLLWLVGALGTALVTVIWFGVSRHLKEQERRRVEMRALENSVIKTAQFNQWTNRIDKRFESMEAHFDDQIGQLRNDNRKIVSTVVELLKQNGS